MFDRRLALWLAVCLLVTIAVGLVILFRPSGSGRSGAGEVHEAIAARLPPESTAWWSYEGRVPAEQFQFIVDSGYFREQDRAALLSWQGMTVLPISTDREAEGVIERIDWRFETGLDEAAYEGAKEAIRRVIAATGRGDAEDYIAWAKRRGAFVDEANLDGLHKELQFLSVRDLSSSVGWEQCLRLRSHRLAQIQEGRSLWTGWSADGLTATVYTAYDAEGLRRRLTSVLRAFDSGYTIGRPLARPRVTLEQRLGGDEATTVLDLVFFARHGKPPHVISPYVLRLWWDEQRGAWHPALISSAFQAGAVGQNFLF